MRTSLASLTIVFMVSAVIAEKFGGEKVQVGKKKCTCSFDFTVQGGAAKGRGGCDKKCSGSVSSMSLEGEEYIFTFGMSVKKGKVTIKGAKATAVGGESTTTIGATTEEGTTMEVETTEGPGEGAGSGSGSGQTPVTMPPMGGGGSGEGPGGNGGGPTGGNGGGNGGGAMSSGNCANGFVLVCPEVDGSCQEGAHPICPLEMPAGRMMPPAPQGGPREDCMCLPIVLMQLVMARPEVMPLMRSLQDTEDLDRQSGDGDKFPAQPVQVGKKKCKCSFAFVVDGKNVKASGSCDKKCSGAVKTMELEGENFSYTFGMSVKKGKVAIKGAKATAMGGEESTTTRRPATGGGGSGSGRPPVNGGGSGSGMPGGGIGSGCVCVMGPGGDGGHGSGSGRPPVGGTTTGSPGGSGSGSGETPITMPTGETPISTMPTGNVTMPTVATTGSPGGNGTGYTTEPSAVPTTPPPTNPVPTTPPTTTPPQAKGPYIPGEAGGAWSEDEISIVREKVQEMLNPDNYAGYHLYKMCNSATGLFVCDGSVYDMVPFVPEKQVQDNAVNCNIRCPKTSRVIQLAFHDCIKYTDGAADDAVNGCDGCLNFGGVGFEFKETWFVGNEDKPPFVNHFTKSYPIEHKTTNNGLEGSVRALEMIYTDPSWPSSARSLNASLKESGKSRADLWAFAGNVALEMEIVRANYACDVDVGIQQVTALEGRDKCDIKLHRPIKFRYGRRDCIPEEGMDAPYKTTRAENHDNPWGHGDDVIASFKRDFNTSAEETIALLAAHGVQARGHNKILATKYAWPGTPYLSNMYFKHWAEKPTYTLDPDVDGFDKLSLALAGDKEGRPVDNFGYRLVCTAMWNLTDTPDDGPCYFKRQPNMGKGSTHRSSSVYAAEENFGAQLAVDGKVVDYGWHWFSTKAGERNPWLELKLAKTKTITSVSFSSRMDCCWDKIKNVEIRAGLNPIGESPGGEPLTTNTVCSLFAGPVTASQRGQDIKMTCSEPIQADYISIQLLAEDGTMLTLNEVKINDEPNVQYFATESEVGEFFRSSSIGFNGKPENFGPGLAVDGNVVNYGWDWFSSDQELNPWLELKLAEKTIVSSITFQGNPACCWNNLKNVEVRAGMLRLDTVVPGALLDINTVCGIFVGPGGQNEELTVECSSPIEAEYITLQMKETGNLQINELKVNGAPNTGKNFMEDKPEDEYLRPICFDTKRKANNPNLDGELLKIPKKYVDENGDQIGGNDWWSIKAPADCCDDAALLDIPNNKNFKIQTGGCKQVLNNFGDKHSFMLNFEMSLFKNMSINKNNRPHGCQGLEPMTMEENGAKWTGMVANENVGCGRNMKSVFSAAGMAYSEIIERFAADHDDWAVSFLEGWQKMTTNGYSGLDLEDGPQSSWLAYESWTKVGAPTSDFEQYIVANSPAKISNNAAEDPQIMNNYKANNGTYKQMCEVKRGMTSWNKNFPRCPRGLFDF